MRVVIGLIIFWLTILSIKLFLERKFKVPNIFSFALSFTAIGIIEFILGILNLMKLGSLILVILALGYLCYLGYKKEFKKKNVVAFLKNPVNVILMLVFVYITLVSINMRLVHYDNFSHWGLIIKVLFNNNRLPNFENDYIMFKGYQPGSACFIYFIGLLCGKKEGLMILGQNYLIFSYVTVLFNYIKGKDKILKALLLVCLYVFMMSTSLIRYNNLLVDTLIAVILVVGLLIVNYYKDDLKKAFLYSLPISIYLFLVKNTGLILAGFICLYILYLAFTKKKLKEGIKYVVITGGVLLGILLIWQGHVELVYGHWALNSKHSLSPQNMWSSLRALGLHNLLSFVKMYIINLFDIIHNIPNIYMIFIDLIGIGFAFLVKNTKKVLKFLGVLNLLYLMYYCILGVMYILSMPWEEAKILASYQRYMMTIIDVVVSLFIVYILSYKDKIKYYKATILVVCIVMLAPIYFYRADFMGMLGYDTYKGSLVEEADKIVDKVPKGQQEYYIYYPRGGRTDYLMFILTYKLGNKNISFVTKDEELSKVQNNSYLIMFDEYKGEYDLENEGFEKVNNVTYRRV